MHRTEAKHLGSAQAAEVGVREEHPAVGQSRRELLDEAAHLQIERSDAAVRGCGGITPASSVRSTRYASVRWAVIAAGLHLPAAIGAAQRSGDTARATSQNRRQAASCSTYKCPGG